MKHAIIIEESLTDRTVLENYRPVNKKVSGSWHLDIIEIDTVENAITGIQAAMVSDQPYYWHIYDDGEVLIVVFRDKVFNIDPKNQATWQEAKEYGAAKLNIPVNELDFFPTRISEESEWLEQGD